MLLLLLYYYAMQEMSGCYFQVTLAKWLKWFCSLLEHTGSEALNIPIVLVESPMIYTICLLTMVSDIILTIIIIALISGFRYKQLPTIDQFNIRYTALMIEACSPSPMYDSRFYQECYELVHNTFGVDLYKYITHLKCINFLLHHITSLWHCIFINHDYEFNLSCFSMWMQTAFIYFYHKWQKSLPGTREKEKSWSLLSFPSL